MAHCLRLVELYRRRFPERWAASVPAISLAGLPAVLSDGLAAVDATCFPVYLGMDTLSGGDVWSDLEETCALLDRVPVALFGPGDDDDRLDEPACCLAQTILSGDASHVLERWPALRIPAACLSAEGDDPESIIRRIEALCPCGDDPLRALAVVCRQLIGGTGNLFLDASDDVCGSPACFGRGGEIDLDWFDDFDWLMAEWQAAELQLEQIKALSDWLDADPTTRLQAAIDRLFSEQGGGSCSTRVSVSSCR